MSDGFDRNQYTGTAPSVLRIELRADKSVRFRITTLDGREAVADLAPRDASQLAENIRQVVGT